MGDDNQRPRRVRRAVPVEDHPTDVDHLPSPPRGVSRVDTLPADFIESISRRPHLIGDVIAGRYKLIETLGDGAMGQVFVAENLAIGSRVAIKVLKAELLSDASFRRRFQHEAMAIAAIEHRNVARFFDLIVGDPTFLVMEFVAGPTLSKVLKQQRKLPLSRAINIAVRLAWALDAAHRAGVIHRDIKPGNVILAPDPELGEEPKLIDFGLAKLPTIVGAQELTRTGQIVGTPQYMSPEQIANKDIDARSDVYALGCLLYHLIAGRPPFVGGDDVQTLYQQIENAPPSLRELDAEVPEPVDALVQQALAKRPEARQQSMQQLAAMLGAVDRRRSSSTVPVASSGASDAAWWKQRVRTGWAALAFVVAFVVAATVFYRYQTMLPVRDRRIVFEAVNAGGHGDDWIAPALAAMATHRLRNRENRVQAFESAAAANTTVRLSYRRTESGFELRASVGPRSGWLRDLASAKAPSVSAAVDEMLGAVVRSVAEGQPPRVPTDSERAQMKRLGTDSFDAFLSLESADADAYGAVFVDVGSLVHSYDHAIELDPDWLHPYLEAADNYGFGSDRWKEELARAEKIAARTERDPLGHHVLTALRQVQAGNATAAASLLHADFAQNPDDLLIGWVLAKRIFAPDGRIVEAASTFQQLYSSRPDLQFGENLISTLRNAGRGREVPAVVDAWLKRAPDNEEAYVSEVDTDLESDRPDEGVRHAREMLFLFGDAPNRLATLCSALINAGDLRSAAEVADQMLRGSGVDRARGWAFHATIAGLEGRFGQALSSFQAAIAEGRPFTTQASLGGTFESRLWLAVAAGARADAEKAAGELADYSRAINDPWSAATADLEREILVRAPQCPDVSAAVARLPAGTARDAFRVRMLRLAAAAGCGSCREVIALGSVNERSQASLYQFGVCAESEGQFELARDAFTRITGFRMETTSAESVAHSVLARFHLARVLEKLGRPAEAKQRYQSFLNAWGHADRPLAEIDAARSALAALH